VLLVGRRGLLIEWSSALNRPYWRLVETEDIVQTEFMRLASGITAPSRLLLREWRDDGRIEGRSSEYRIEHYLQELRDGTGDNLRVWYEYRVRAWRERTPEEIQADPTGERFEPFGDVRVPLRLEEPLDRIPFVFLVSAGTGKVAPKPPMLDLVDTNLSHYRTSAEREEGAHWTACPTPAGSNAAATTCPGCWR
jgi:hypothetical protein